MGAVLPRVLRRLFDGCVRAKAGVLVDEFLRDRPIVTNVFAVLNCRADDAPGGEDEEEEDATEGWEAREEGRAGIEEEEEEDGGGGVGRGLVP